MFIKCFMQFVRKKFFSKKASSMLTLKGLPVLPLTVLSTMHWCCQWRVLISEAAELEGCTERFYLRFFYIATPFADSANIYVGTQGRHTRKTCLKRSFI